MIALAILGGISGFAVLWTVSAVLNGWALSVLWGWFMVPTLGLPEITIVSAIGIAMVVSYLTYQYDASKKEYQSFGKQTAVVFGTAFLRPLVALLFGWIVHLFM